MTEFRIKAENRTEFGKGAARRVRRDGRIPAVLYGHGTEARHLTLGAREFGRILKSGANTVLTLDVDGGTELALAKAVSRHALKDYIEHVDLILVRRGEKVTVDVRIIIVGEAAPDTMVLAGHNTLSIEVEALHIPDSIEVSIEGVEAGTMITAADVTLPVGATLAADPETLIVGITQAPTAEQLESEGSGESAQPVAAAPAETEE
jgi:large subunit ribosomal protein L25